MCALIYNHGWLRFNYIYIFIQLIITNHNVEKPIVQIITVVNPNPCFDRIKLNLTESRPNISFKDLVTCAYIIITYGYLKKKQNQIQFDFVVPRLPGFEYTWPIKNNYKKTNRCL